MASAFPEAKRVLIIDDDAAFSRVVADFLRGRGYDVGSVGTGTEALLALERFMPQVILLDIRMPGVTGLDVLKVIRSRFSAPRIIVVSAVDAEEAGQEALRLGASLYMCKPIDLNQLEQLISGIWPPASQSRAPST